MDDRQLLRQFAQSGDHEAFAKLLRLHGDWVYSAARRQLGDEHLAEDVTQAVFMLLHRKAGLLSRYARLGGWLFRAVQCCVREARRQRARQQKREREAAKMRNEAQTPEPIWEQISPVLDDAVGQLKKADREALLLRFYQQKPLADVAAALGVSEEAARKRVDRAVQRLRGYLATQGVTATSAGLSAVVLPNVSGQIPRHLADMIAAGGWNAGAGTMAGAISKGAMKTMMWAKVKLAVGILACAALAAGIAVAAVPNAKAEAAKGAGTRPSAPTLTLASMADVKVLHGLTTYSGDLELPKVVDAWFVRGKGIAMVGRYSDGVTAVHLDDGVNTWRYRVGGPVVGRSVSESTVDEKLTRAAKRIGDVVDSGLVSKPDSDQIHGPERWRCYEVMHRKDGIQRIWVDDRNRLRRYWDPESQENQMEIRYDEEPDRDAFSTTWPAGAQIIDTDSYLADRFPVETALFSKEAAGILFAVHEAKKDAQGCYQMIVSTRLAKGVAKELGLSRGYMGNASVERMLRSSLPNGAFESQGYIPLEIADLQSGYGWVQVRWYVLAPDPETPDLHDALQFVMRVRAANELETLRKRKNLPSNGEFTVQLEDREAAAGTSEDFARSAYADVNRLWPAVDGSLAVVVPSQKGNGIQNSQRPGSVTEAGFVQNVQKRVSHSLNPQSPSPWQAK